jgi:predicted permease
VTLDVDDELGFHLDQMAAELRAAGWSEADARAEAVRRFGDLDFTRRYCRAEDIRRERGKRRMTFFDDLTQDLHYGVRALRRSPGFAAAALLTLALGIGANTAIFSVVRGVLLDPLPFYQPDRIVRVWHAHRANSIDRGWVSEPDFLDWRAQSKLAESMGGFFNAGMDLTGTGDPEHITSALVTDGFFETLRTPALIGRTLIADDQVEGRNRVVVLSHDFWTRRFAGDATLVGRTITLNNEPFQVVGVMPPGFVYPAAQALDTWVPVSFFGPDDIGRSRGAHFLSVLARMKPGVTEAQLNAELSTIAARLSQEYPDNPGWDSVSLLGIRESIVGEVQQPLMVLMAAVAMLLLVACVNLASLLLARATGRRQELAVRAALGAGRGRIARQLLTESLTLALLGGVLGAILGVVAVRALAATGASELPRAGDIRVDGIVLAFTLAVSVIAGLLFGIMPAMRASSDLEHSLRAGSRGNLGGSGQKLRSALVVAEVALASILVIGAGLATKSFARLAAVDPGFNPSNAIAVTLSVPAAYDNVPDEARFAYYYKVLAAIRAIPGVVAAGSARDLPLRGGNGEMVRPNVPGMTLATGEGPTAQRHHISTDYFKALGVPVLAGRTFEMTDRAGAPPVIVINEELAKRIWPGQNAVGKTLRFGDLDIPVIGVVGNFRQRGLTEPVDPALYLHVLQQFRSRMSIVVRTNGDPLQYMDAIRKTVWAQDPTQTITSLTTLEAVLGDSMTRPRLLAWLLALFGVIGLTLGAVGIFGVLAYAVNQRRQEIGVRVALGATPGSVLGLVVRQGMVLAVAGVVIGVLAASLLTRSMQGVLFDIRASDPVTFVQVVVVLLSAALLASWLPARRAVAIDPVSALRAD